MRVAYPKRFEVVKYTNVIITAAIHILAIHYMCIRWNVWVAASVLFVKYLFDTMISRTGYFFADGGFGHSKKHQFALDAAHAFRMTCMAYGQYVILRLIVHAIATH